MVHRPAIPDRPGRRITAALGPETACLAGTRHITAAGERSQDRERRAALTGVAVVEAGNTEALGLAKRKARLVVEGT
jgi:hypothetical protein